MRELTDLDATGQAELVRAGEVSPEELIEAAILRIEKVDPAINAIVSPLFDYALKEASSPDLPGGPFRGVPFLLKDLGPGLAGLPVYEGNRVLREIGFYSKMDGPVAARFRNAGLIVMGKTATPEFGAQPTTQAIAFGPTRNPWDPSRSTSGSSGGAGAAVASGMVPMAHASDGGGSIRQPASWCGLVGLKPSRGRVPRGPLISRLGTELVVSRSVRDTAQALDCIEGPVTGDLYQLFRPERPYIEEAGAEPGKLRIGLTTKVDASGVDIHPESVRAAEDAGRLLESLGHEVEAAGPPRLFDDEFLETAEIDYGCMMRATVQAMWSALGRPLGPGEIEPYSWERIERMKETSAVEHVKARSWLQRYAIRIASWWEQGFDLLLTPSTGEPPAPLEELVPDEDDPWAIDHGRFSRIRCFVRPFNVTGHPGISLPLGWTKEGLPQGIQLVAAMGREDLLIRVASQLEAASPWTGRRPEVFAGS